MEVTALGWMLTIAVIVALLALDLSLGVLRPHAVGFREAAAWSVFYIAVAVAFGFVLAAHTDLSHAVPEISTPVSLAVIVGVLAVTTVASLLKSGSPQTRKDPDTEEGARVVAAPLGAERRQPR